MTQGRSAVVAAVVLWLLCGLYASRFIYRGWIPHDEGTIGQTAERVLAGEVPHRDFDDMYTGGLTYLHAAGMKMFGVSLRTPRLIVFAFFMAFLAAVHAIGRRIASPVGALIAMALAAVWSLPNYFVSLPSWYNLFFATFAVLALLHFLETRHRRWLVLAGACGGLSILAKITGLFSVAAGLLFLTYLEQDEMLDSGAGGTRRSSFWLVVAAPVAAFLFLLFRTLLSRDHTGGAIGLFLPATAVSLFVVWRERHAHHGSLQVRLRRLLALQWPFIAGVAIPLVAYLAWFWSQGAIDELVRGVFVLPQRRLAESSINPPAIAGLALGVPFVWLLLAGLRRPLPREGVLAMIAAVGSGALLLLGYQETAYRISWAMAFAMPIVVVAASLFVLADRHAVIEAASQTRVFLVVTMAALVALVQFPYFTPTYFCYAASMTMLAVVAVVFAQPSAPRRLHLVVAAFFFIFAIVFVNRSYAWNLGLRFLPYNPTSQLDLERGGLWVSDESKQDYERLVAALRQHATGGTILAGPDCPEVYFLSGFPNRTRAIFDFLTPEPLDEPAIARLLSDKSIKAAVINTQPLFSPAIQPGVLQLLERRFPSSERIGRFVVRFE